MYSRVVKWFPKKPESNDDVLGNQLQQDVATELALKASVDMVVFMVSAWNELVAEVESMDIHVHVSPEAENDYTEIMQRLRASLIVIREAGGRPEHRRDAEGIYPVTTTEDVLTDEVVEREVVEAGKDALNQVHAFEREMLNRAVYSLSDITGKTPEAVLGILCEGLDKDYQAAVEKVEAAARVAQTLIKPPAPRIVVPGH